MTDFDRVKRRIGNLRTNSALVKVHCDGKLRRERGNVPFDRLSNATDYRLRFLRLRALENLEDRSKREPQGPHFDGIKYESDMGLSVEGAFEWGGFGLAYAAQYFFADAQTNGSLRDRETVWVPGASAPEATNDVTSNTASATRNIVPGRTVMIVPSTSIAFSEFTIVDFANSGGAQLSAALRN